LSVLWLTAALSLTACGGGDDHDEAPKIDRQAAQSAVDRFRISSARPGMSAAIASDKFVLWTGVSGAADVSTKRAPLESTPFFTASVGKLVTVAAAMQLVEAGKLSLDADIAGVLGYPVENPAFLESASRCATCWPMCRAFRTTAFWRSPRLWSNSRTATPT